MVGLITYLLCQRLLFLWLVILMKHWVIGTLLLRKDLGDCNVLMNYILLFLLYNILSALSHYGMVGEGRYWFDAMIREYKVGPVEKHYASLVDLLALEEARGLVEDTGCEPGIAVWVALLSGCLNHNKILVGEFAAKKVLELKPNCPGIYTLVSNFFAAARKWEEVSMVRREMRAAGIKKVPGYSVTEVSGRLHGFVVEDKSHLEYEQILGILEGMEPRVCSEDGGGAAPHRG